MRTGFKPGWVLTVLVVMALGVLLLLGTWQVQRLSWKSEQIALISERLALPPVALDEEGASIADFSRVTLEASFASDLIWFRGIKTRADVPGTHIMMIAKAASGRHWLVERGWVSNELKDGVLVPLGEHKLTGILRPAKRRGYFTPDDDFSASRIYAEDLAILSERISIELEDRVLQLSEKPAGLTLIEPHAGGPDLRNNHLGYALTWYGLAGALIGVFIAFGRLRAKEGEA